MEFLYQEKPSKRVSPWIDLGLRQEKAPHLCEACTRGETRTPDPLIKRLSRIDLFRP